MVHRVRVELHDDCIRFGGCEEYPNGRVGTEAVPARIASQKANEAAALAGYRASAPVIREGLRYIKFEKPFVGQDDRGRPKQKTDSQNGMWIPSWLLKPAA